MPDPKDKAPSPLEAFNANFQQGLQQQQAARPPAGTTTTTASPGAQGNYVAQNLTREGFATEQQIQEQGGVLVRQGFYVMPNGTAFEYVPNQGWRHDATPYLGDLSPKQKAELTRIFRAQAAQKQQGLQVQQQPVAQQQPPASSESLNPFNVSVTSPGRAGSVFQTRDAQGNRLPLPQYDSATQRRIFANPVAAQPRYFRGDSAQRALRFPESLYGATAIDVPASYDRSTAFQPGEGLVTQGLDIPWQGGTANLVPTGYGTMEIRNTPSGGGEGHLMSTNVRGAEGTTILGAYGQAPTGDPLVDAANTANLVGQRDDLLAQGYTPDQVQEMLSPQYPEVAPGSGDPGFYQGDMGGLMSVSTSTAPGMEGTTFFSGAAKGAEVEMRDPFKITNLNTGNSIIGNEYGGWQRENIRLGNNRISVIPEGGGGQMPDRSAWMNQTQMPAQARPSWERQPPRVRPARPDFMSRFNLPTRASLMSQYNMNGGLQMPDPFQRPNPAQMWQDWQARFPQMPQWPGPNRVPPPQPMPLPQIEMPQPARMRDPFQAAPLPLGVRGAATGATIKTSYTPGMDLTKLPNSYQPGMDIGSLPGSYEPGMDIGNLPNSYQPGMDIGNLPNSYQPGMDLGNLPGSYQPGQTNLQTGQPYAQAPAPSQPYTPFTPRPPVQAAPPPPPTGGPPIPAPQPVPLPNPVPVPGPAPGPAPVPAPPPIGAPGAPPTYLTDPWVQREAEIRGYNERQRAIESGLMERYTGLPGLQAINVGQHPGENAPAGFYYQTPDFARAIMEIEQELGSIPNVGTAQDIEAQILGLKEQLRNLPDYQGAIIDLQARIALASTPEQRAEYERQLAVLQQLATGQDANAATQIQLNISQLQDQLRHARNRDELIRQRDIFRGQAEGNARATQGQAQQPSALNPSSPVQGAPDITNGQFDWLSGIAPDAAYQLLQLDNNAATGGAFAAQAYQEAMNTINALTDPQARDAASALLQRIVQRRNAGVVTPPIGDRLPPDPFTAMAAAKYGELLERVAA